MRWIRIDVPDELHKALRILAAKRELTIKALVIEALKQLVQQDDKTKEKK